MPNGNEQLGKEEAEEEKTIAKEKELSPFLSPEAIVMFFIAGLFDFAGFVCLLLIWIFGIGELASVIIDIIGFFFFGFWMLIRTFVKFTMSGEFSMEGIKTAAKKTSKSFGKIAKRLGLTTVVELIPIVGDISITWILLVYYEIKSDIPKK